MAAEQPHILVLTCPHCEGTIVVQRDELNCRIFRHAIYKHDGSQLNPHAPKEVCDQAVAADAVHGCGKPFRVNADDKAEPCDYI